MICALNNGVFMHGIRRIVVMRQKCQKRAILREDEAEFVFDFVQHAWSEKFETLGASSLLYVPDAYSKRNFFAIK